VKFDASYPPGLVFYPQHHAEPNLRDLIPCKVDAETDVPYFKLGNVEIERKKNQSEATGFAGA
jgi:hypothetical protein